MSIAEKPKGSWILRTIIFVLVLVLAYVIYEPYQRKLQEDAFRAESRLRMGNIREGQLRFIGTHGYYAGSIDSLIHFITTDSLLVAQRDEIFKPLSHGVFSAESLRYSPKTHRPYRLEVDNESVVKKYFLECPDGYGHIGSLEDETMINKASWEE